VKALLKTHHQLIVSVESDRSPILLHCLSKICERIESERNEFLKFSLFESITTSWSMRSGWNVKMNRMNERNKIRRSEESVEWMIELDFK
jgi:hypothetical protein